jgi:hypothetical protein
LPEYVPTTQSSQAVPPELAWNDPGGQPSHVLAPFADDEPAAQFVQLAAPSPE